VVVYVIFVDVQARKRPTKPYAKALTDIMEVDVGQLENAFNAASLLANQAWMRLGSGSETHSLSVSYGMGNDTLLL
jgi:hypothetical protein